MKEIKVTPYDCVEDVVKEALAKANRQSWCRDIGFVGNADFIQDVLKVVLQNTDYVVDVIDIDTYDYGNIYQLTIDTEDFVSVLPISTDNGYGKPRKYPLEQVQVFAHHESCDTTKMYLKNHDDDIINSMFF